MAVPAFFRVVLRHLADRGAGVVHQDIESPELHLRLRHQPHAICFLRDVGGNERRLHPERPQRFKRGLRLFRIAAGDHDGCAARRHPLRHAQPDAAIAAGDQRHLTAEVEEIHLDVRSWFFEYW